MLPGDERTEVRARAFDVADRSGEVRGHFRVRRCSWEVAKLQTRLDGIEDLHVSVGQPRQGMPEVQGAFPLLPLLRVYQRQQLGYTLDPGTGKPFVHELVDRRILSHETSP